MKYLVDITSIATDRYEVEVPDDVQDVEDFLIDWMLDVCPGVPLSEAEGISFQRELETWRKA